MPLRKPLGADSSAARFGPIVPDDAADHEEARALYVGASGDVVARNDDGDDVAFKAVPAGTVLPVRTRRVMATGTTAGAIVALY